MEGMSWRGTQVIAALVGQDTPEIPRWAWRPWPPKCPSGPGQVHNGLSKSGRTAPREVWRTAVVQQSNRCNSSHFRLQFSKGVETEPRQ